MRVSGVVAVAAGLAALIAAPAEAITGGSVTAEGTYGFVAKVETEGLGCTGALVAPQWIITATTCFGATGVQAGPPPKPAKATIGRTNLAHNTGSVVKIVSLVPRADRNLTLAKLDTPVFDIAPLVLTTTAPQQGDALRLAGFGRTATEWVPDQLSTTAFTVNSVAGGTLDAVGAPTVAATTCKGDSGGPAFREIAGKVELAAINATSWQNGCLSEKETRQRTVETRVDDIADWVRQQIPAYAIRNFNGLCTTVATATTGTRATIAKCVAGNVGQQWSLPGDGTVRTSNGLCLTANESAVVTSDCVAGDARQQWRFTADGTLRTAAGACADLGSNAPGAAVLLTNCVADNISQQWGLRGDGALRNSNGLCVDLGSNDPGTLLSMVSCQEGNPSQRWGLMANGTLRNTNRLCADLSSNQPGTKVEVTTCGAGLVSQQWTLPADGTLRNKNGLCADLESNDPGSVPVITDCVAGNSSQQWILSR